MEMFRNGLQKLVLSEEIKKSLDFDICYLLENIGIPKKIVYSELEFIKPKIEDGIFHFGYANHLTEMKFGIELKSNKVITYGKRGTSDYYSVINQSFNKLLLCSYCNDFFIRRLILSELLGKYHEHHDKYAKLLRELIFDIDEEATKSGAWSNLIEEMSLGVI